VVGKRAELYYTIYRLTWYTRYSQDIENFIGSIIGTLLMIHFVIKKAQGLRDGIRKEPQ
jgi:Uma2 family endonuclease